MLGRQIIQFFTLFSIFEFFNCQKRILDISRSGIKKELCLEGYKGENCTVSTCIGYTLCKNESICVIKNNTHACVCQFLDYDGNNRQFEDCIGKYNINNGVCYLNKNGEKYCKCFKNLRGENCESKIKFKSVKEKLKKWEKSIFSWNGDPVCRFYYRGKEHVLYWCQMSRINHGFKYEYFTWILDPSPNYFYACDDGWDKGKDECDTPSCKLFNPCKNLGTCHDQNHEFTCTCPIDYYGYQCQNQCKSSCVHGKNIYNTQNNSCECKCDSGFFPPLCEDLTTPIIRSTTTPSTTTPSTTTPSTTTITTTSKTTPSTINASTTTRSTTTPSNTTPSNTTLSTTTITTTTKTTPSTSNPSTTPPSITINTRTTTQSTTESSATTPPTTPTNTSKNTLPTTAHTKNTVSTIHAITDSTMESTKRSTITEYTIIVTTNSKIPINASKTTTDYNTESTTNERSLVDSSTQSNRIKLAYIAIPAFFILAAGITGIVFYYKKIRGKGILLTNCAHSDSVSRL